MGYSCGNSSAVGKVGAELAGYTLGSVANISSGGGSIFIIVNSPLKMERIRSE
jgi:hypothetical protein